LTPFEAGFTKWLGHKGYAAAVVRIHERRMIHLSLWMQVGRRIRRDVAWERGGRFAA